MTAIRHVQDGPVARILIDNAARRNAVSRAMWRALAPACAAAGSHPATRVVALESAVDGAFCAGADIAEFEATYRDSAETAAANAEIQAAVTALASIPLPTIALIDGACVGGGVSLVIACDLRLASDRSTFAVTPARLGLSYHPDDVERLATACGFARAAELLFTARPWNAREALAAGLVNRLVPADAFATECAAVIGAVAASSRDALAALKQALGAVRHHDPQARALATARFQALFDGRDFHEGRDAFLQKRPPRFPSHQDEPEHP